MNTQTKAKKALVLGGGGSRGSFTIGAIKALADHHARYDLVTGTSIGALVGAVYVQQNMTNFKAFIDNFNKDSVAENLFVFPEGKSAGQGTYENGNAFLNAFCQDGPSVAPLRKNYAKLFNFDDFKNSPIDFACVSFNVTKNEPAIFKKADMTKDNVMDQLIASTAYFPAFNLIEMNGDFYADGGYAKLPLGQEAVDMGATELTVIGLHSKVDDVPLAKADIKLYIHPILQLKYFLNFDSLVLKEQILQGYYETLKFMDLAPGYIYTFYWEDSILFEILSKLISDVAQKENIKLDQSMFIAGMSELLGYTPGKLDNKYMKDYSAGLILELLGLIAGVSPYQQYHVREFISLIDQQLHTLNTTSKTWEAGTMAVMMENHGARDMIVFFHDALSAFGGKLPPEVDGIKSQYGSLFYLAVAWYILDKFQLRLPVFLHSPKQ